jgi:hypothetical protein
MQEMLAAAEADLKSDTFDGSVKEGGEICRRGRGEIDPEYGEECLDRLPLARP